MARIKDLLCVLVMLMADTAHLIAVLMWWAWWRVADTVIVSLHRTHIKRKNQTEVVVYTRIQ